MTEQTENYQAQMTPLQEGDEGEFHVETDAETIERLQKDVLKTAQERNLAEAEVKELRAERQRAVESMEHQQTRLDAVGVIVDKQYIASHEIYDALDEILTCQLPLQTCPWCGGMVNEETKNCRFCLCRQLAECEKAYTMNQADLVETRSQLAEKSAQLEKAREALRQIRYIAYQRVHDSCCEFYKTAQKCTCGHEETLARIEAALPPEQPEGESK